MKYAMTLVLLLPSLLAYAQPQWEQVSLAGNAVNYLFPHPTQPEVWFAVAGTRYDAALINYGLLRSSDSGESWTTVVDTTAPASIRIFGLAFHPTSPDTILACTNTFSTSAYLWSTDSGRTWTERFIVGASLPLSGTISLAYNHTVPDEVFMAFAAMGGTRELYRSTDGGVTFTFVRTIPILGGGAQLVTFAAHPQELYVLPAGPRSTDGGETWEAPFSDGLHELWSLSGAVIPNTRMFAPGVIEYGVPAIRNGLIAFRPGQRDFEIIREFPEVRSLRLACHPQDSTRLVLYNFWRENSETFRAFDQSTDGGQNWHALSRPPLSIFALQYSLNGDYLYAGLGGITDSSGLWRLATSSATEPRPDVPSASAIQLQCYPNPVNGTARIAWSVPSASPVELTLYDILGRTIQSINYKGAASGSHTTLFDLSSCVTGQYFIMLQSEAGTVTRRVNILR